MLSTKTKKSKYILETVEDKVMEIELHCGNPQSPAMLTEDQLPE